MGNEIQIDDISAAVALERKAAEQPRAKDKIGANVHALRPNAGSTGGFLELKLDTPLPDAADQLSVSWQKTQVRGQLMSLHLADDGAPIIEVKVPEIPAAGIRRVQVAPVQEALFVALDEVLGALTPQDCGLAAFTTDPQAHPTRLDLVPVSPHDLAQPGQQWNTAQQRVLEHALGNDLTYVWGPPGTGKTDLLAAVVEGAVRQGHRTLFVAPTKVAVDQALLRIASRLRNYPGFATGLVQRWGSVELPALNEQYGQFVDRDRIRARLSGELGAKKTKLVEQRESVSALAEAHSRRIRLQSELAALAEQRERATRQLNAATSSGAARMWKKLSGETVPGPEQVAQLSSSLEMVNQAFKACAKKIDDLGPAKPGERAATGQLKRLEEQIDEIDKQLERQDQLLRETLAVAAATVDGAVQRRTAAGSFDTVVIDEVGMMHLPKVVAAASMASTRLVIVGDFRQLPAVVQTTSSKVAAARDKTLYASWYERDAFDAAGLVSPQGQAVTAPKLVSLDTQYRMRRGICELVNTTAYPDRPLITGRPDEPKVRSTVMTAPVILVDTSATGQIMATSSPTFNPVHAAVVREVLRALQADDVLPLRRSGAVREDLVRTLGVIAPYQVQVKRLDAQVRERFGENVPRNIVNTVHSFQGSERPIMLLDTVAHTGSGDLGPFYWGTALSSTTTRLLNVALSRAQDHLIVVANADLLRTRSEPDSSTRRMIEHLAKHAQVVPAGNLVPTRSAAQLRTLTAEEREIPAFFAADETPAAVEYDIDQAERSVDIYCPFISGATLRSRLGPLKAATARGVKLTVWTRATTVDEQPTLIAGLRELGAVIEQRDQMHEKLIIIDSSIVWHGSYNYFAHTRATELMLRMPDERAAKEAVWAVQRAQATRPASNWPPQRSHQTASRDEDRVDLDVSFAQKDKAKKLGARWDPRSRTWWVTRELMETGQFEAWRIRT